MRGLEYKIFLPKLSPLHCQLLAATEDQIIAGSGILLGSSPKGREERQRGGPFMPPRPGLTRGHSASVSENPPVPYENDKNNKEQLYSLGNDFSSCIHGVL
jgi:hypothetical protein